MKIHQDNAGHMTNAYITFAPGTVRFICLQFSVRFLGIVGMTADYGLCLHL